MLNVFVYQNAEGFCQVKKNTKIWIGQTPPTDHPYPSFFFFGNI